MLILFFLNGSSILGRQISVLCKNRARQKETEGERGRGREREREREGEGERGRERERVSFEMGVEFMGAVPPFVPILLFVVEFFDFYDFAL